MYGLDEDEIKKENKHIRFWDRLIPGIKLKIPVISERIDNEITTMDPFIEDYYPKLKLDLDNLENQKFQETNKESAPINNHEFQEVEVKDDKEQKKETKTSFSIEDIPELKKYNEMYRVDPYEYQRQLYYEYLKRYYKL